jgi:predicted membrane-bound spermidine synthase
MTYRIRTLYALFAVSGFCGLIYESIWGQYLKLFLGHAAYAQTVVLIVFIGGLALGSWAAGALALRLARPLLAYAAAELLVGIAALTFHWVYLHATDWAYAHLLPAACSAEHWCWSQWVFAGLLILPQSVLLGTTFPLMSGGILRLDAQAAGGKLSLLYFLNSIGAVAGVLTSGYVLIPGIGLPGALTTAGLMNVLLAIVVYFVDKNTHPAAAVGLEPGAAPSGAAERGFVATMLAVALATGLSSFIYEVAWIRSLSLVLGASTHSFELMLAAFILGLALGGLWIRGRIDAIGDVVRFLGIVQVVMGLLALATLPTYQSTFDLMGWLIQGLQRSESGWVLFNVSSSLICLVVMLPATFMAGMTLPLITYALMRSRLGEKSIGHVYAANTLGGILGVAIAVHFALPVLGLKGALVLGGAIDAALGVWLLWRAPLAGRRMRQAWSAIAAVGVLATAFFFHLDPLKLASGVFNFGRPRLTLAEVLYHVDGRTATVTVTRTAKDFISIATNGKVDGGMSDTSRPGPDEYTMLLLGSLPLAHRPDARDVAVIGYGTGMSTTVLLGSPTVRRVDTVEIEPEMLRGAQAFRFFTDPAYTDPRSHIIIDDAKSYFARSPRRYDAILSEPSNPWVSGVASLFSREFYARARGKLNDGGILVQWLHTYSFSDPLLASILRALRESFPAFVIYAANSGDLVVVASPSGKVPPLDAAVLGLGRVHDYLGRIEIRRVEDLAIRRVADQDTVYALFDTIEVAPNSDYFPIVDSGASRDRYLALSAGSIHDLGVAPWPILEMTARPPLPPESPLTIPTERSNRRTDAAVRTQVAFGLLTGAAVPEAQAREQLGEFHRPFAMFRDRFIACGSDFPAKDLWDVVEVVASHVSVFLPPAESSQVWERVRRSGCFAKLPEPVRNWFAVFDALGRRDAAESARTALAALETATGEAQTSYFYGAAMTALIAAGRMDEARKVYDRYHGKLPEQAQLHGWFRWIEGSVLGAGAPGAPVGAAPRAAGGH